MLIINNRSASFIVENGIAPFHPSPVCPQICAGRVKVGGIRAPICRESSIPGSGGEMGREGRKKILLSNPTKRKLPPQTNVKQNEMSNVNQINNRSRITN